jgi:hypothetical protein
MPPFPIKPPTPGQPAPRAPNIQAPAPAGPFPPLSEYRQKALALAPKVDLLGRPIDRCNPADPVLIPRLDEFGENQDFSKGPGWSPRSKRATDGSLVKIKPLIRCKCGAWSGIGLHPVFADGRVMASFFDATAAQLAAMGEAGKRFSPGCGWHVFIKLDGYDCGPFPAEK